ncbi:MAG: hypothetical protein JSV03_12755, partial [Planctomycetota bacterium]
MKGRQREDFLPIKVIGNITMRIQQVSLITVCLLLSLEVGCVLSRPIRIELAGDVEIPAKSM